jgi:ADP-ribose pyrophosphatase
LVPQIIFYFVPWQSTWDTIGAFLKAVSEFVANNVTVHYNGRFLGLKERDSWEYAFRNNASGVVVLVPVTDARELVVVEQYRIPVKSRVLELPAGLVGDNGDIEEDFRTAAQRELIEETGYKATSLEKLLYCPSTPGMADEMINIYYAGGLKRIGPGGGDDSEDITVHHVPLNNAIEWLDNHQSGGVMLDPKIFAGLFWAGMRF